MKKKKKKKKFYHGFCYLNYYNRICKSIKSNQEFNYTDKYHDIKTLHQTNIDYTIIGY